MDIRPLTNELGAEITDVDLTALDVNRLFTVAGETLSAAS